MAYVPRPTVTRPIRGGVLLARESELEPADRWGALFNGVCGATLGVFAIGIFITERVPLLSAGAVILIPMIGVGLVLVLRSTRVLVRRHRLWLLPAQRCIEETWTGWGDVRSQRHDLEAFDSVVLEPKTLESKDKTDETFEAYVVSVTGRASYTLSLGMFVDLNRALDHAIGAARSLGLELVDRASVGEPKLVSATRLGRISAEPDAERSYALPWWRRASAVSLVAANLVPVVGVLWLDWDMLSVMVLYWIENLVIGLVAVLRFLWAVPELRARLVLIPFFLVHYGSFCYGHGVIVVLLFGDGIRASLPGGPMSIASLASLVVLLNLWPGILSLLASHGHSFIHNFVGEHEYRRANGALLLMVEPYKRVMVMHVSVLLAAAAIDALAAPTAALVLMILGKTGLDVHAHLGERRRHSFAGYDAIERR